MGSLVGHCVPGALLVLLAVWWLFHLPRRLLLCRRQGCGFFTTLTFPVPLPGLQKLPVEGILKILLTAVGMALEVEASTGWGVHDEITYMEDIQHMAVYSFFCLAGVLDCITYRRHSCLPRRLDYVVTVLAFLAQATIFMSHITGREELDVLLHTLLVVTGLSCALFVGLEAVHGSSLIVAYLKAYSVVLQGTWLLQTGFVLYPPGPRQHHSAAWNEDRDQQWYNFVPLLFTWHMAGNFVLVLAVYGLCYVLCDRRGSRLGLEVDRELATVYWAQTHTDTT